jgi:pimeloyl-ACP methyl ester carboxylesterase
MPTTASPQVRFRTIDGLRIRYADSGSSHKSAVVLTSPWPESIYAFAPIWASLSEHARLFAVDLPGLGASERREDLLSPRSMGEFLVQLIAEAYTNTNNRGTHPGAISCRPIPPRPHTRTVRHRPKICT